MHPYVRGLVRLIVPLTVVATMVITSACNRAPAEPSVGTYRAVLELPGGEAPFGMQVAKEDGRFVLYLLNGTERTRVPDVHVINGELQATFPGYENSIRARPGRRSLEGNVTLIKAGGVEQAIPFHAQLGPTHRFFAEASTDNVDVSGRWEVQLTNGEGKVTQAVALFDQQHDRLTGTVMTPTGDHRFLDGQVRGEEAWLSTFAGGLAYLYHFKVNGTGELEGEYWQGLKSHEKFVARRNADAQLVDAESMTGMKPDAATLAFTMSPTSAASRINYWQRPADARLLLHERAFDEVVAGFADVRRDLQSLRVQDH